MSDNGKLEYVGFWLRAGALLIDSVIAGVILTFLSLSIYGQDSLYISGYITLMDFLFLFVLTPGAIIFCWIYWQATPGKMVIGAKIVDARTGKAPSTGQYVGRYFSYILSGLVSCLGFVWVGIDKKGQGWHDKLAGTVVVREQAEERFFLDEPSTLEEESVSFAGAKATLEYTGFWRRVLAYLIDSFILGIGITLIGWSIYGMDHFSIDYPMAWSMFRGPVDVLLSMVVSPVAVVLCWIYWQATPGKMIISAKIVDARSGANPTPWQCVRRCLGHIVSGVFALGFLWIAFDERKQGWHDKLAGTVVVRKKNPDVSFADAQSPTREEALLPPSGGAEHDASCEEDTPDKDSR